MKKNYQKPRTEMFEIQLQGQILQASKKGPYRGWGAQVPGLNASDELMA
ncbi:MAG: hypothetical protein J6T97_02010 [Bacteroidaceae bacterium]|nr:hypothetical protein [Bacteroidaceae bacterium]